MAGTMHGTTFGVSGITFAITTLTLPEGKFNRSITHGPGLGQQRSRLE